MNPSNRKRIARAIQCAVPGLYNKGRLLAATPRSSILRGFYIEDSLDVHGVYIWTFVQPLYVPATTLVLSLGERLGGPSHLWGVEAVGQIESVARDGVSWFERCRSPEELCEWDLLNSGIDEYSRQAKAFSLVLSGWRELALRTLQALNAATSDSDLEWRVLIHQRSAQLLTLVESDLNAAVTLLRKWEADTIAALRLEDLP